MPDFVSKALAGPASVLCILKGRPERPQPRPAEGFELLKEMAAGMPNPWETGETGEAGEAGEALGEAAQGGFQSGLAKAAAWAKGANGASRANFDELAKPGAFERAGQARQTGKLSRLGKPMAFGQFHARQNPVDAFGRLGASRLPSFKS